MGSEIERSKTTKTAAQEQPHAKQPANSATRAALDTATMPGGELNDDSSLGLEDGTDE
jgi:hypothetical protein